MRLRPDTLCASIPGLQKAGTLGAILEILLKTRLKLRMDADQREHDEEVNAYLGGLLVSYIDPEYLASIAPVLSPYDLDVYQAVEKASEDRVRGYWVYKVNADDLLVSLGVFHRIWQRDPNGIGRLKRYYAFASEYQRRIYGKQTTLADIQARLAEGPERYLAVLSEARRDYLSFVQQIGGSDCSELLRKIEEKS